ncbi:hypothetical protein SANTM175S_02677 [Streptomyces antimycoticus]
MASQSVRPVSSIVSSWSSTVWARSTYRSDASRSMPAVMSRTTWAGSTWGHRLRSIGSPWRLLISDSIALSLRRLAAAVAWL